MKPGENVSPHSTNWIKVLAKQRQYFDGEMPNAEVVNKPAQPDR
jgi:hypothetical protein